MLHILLLAATIASPFTVRTNPSIGMGPLKVTITIRRTPTPEDRLRRIEVSCLGEIVDQSEHTLNGDAYVPSQLVRTLQSCDEPVIIRVSIEKSDGTTEHAHTTVTVRNPFAEQ